ncbi:hypothetical protein PspLS_01719 [Pyricularia sp. CBS 133598]|nr:hypothetical protein PspLS_01719 [Pyricularia sp. CBS 133598]
MIYRNTFAFFALAAAYLPTAFATTCKIGIKYYQDDKWHYIGQEVEIGETVTVLSGSTKIGPKCEPETKKWHNVEIYRWEAKESA